MYFINSDSWKETPLLKKIDIKNKRIPTTSPINDIKLENNIKYYPRFKQSIKLKNFLVRKKI